jgi:hypothetical protein
MLSTHQKAQENSPNNFSKMVFFWIEMVGKYTIKIKKKP